MALASGVMNLYLLTTEASVASGILSFFTTGSTNAYAYSTLNMYLDASPMENATMNMYISGEANPLPVSGIMNMYLNAQMIPASGMMSFYMMGAVGGGISASNELTGYISGLGETENSIPISGNMNFYLKASPGAEATITMAMPNVYGVESGIASLYMFGVTGVSSGSFNGYLRAYDNLDSTLSLFIRGY